MLSFVFDSLTSFWVLRSLVSRKWMQVAGVNGTKQRSSGIAVGSSKLQAQGSSDMRVRLGRYHVILIRRPLSELASTSTY